MGWKIFQAAIVVGVIFANIPLQFTPNPLAAAFGGYVVAVLITAVTMKLEALWLRIRRPARSQEQPGQSLASAGALSGEVLNPPHPVRPSQQRLR